MSKKFNKEILSIDYDDDNKNLNEFNQFLDDNTQRKKDRDAEQITELGDLLLSEIDHKKSVKEKKKPKLVKYIMSKSDNHSEVFLYDLDYNDLLDIYNEIKFQNKSFFSRLFDFLT